MDFQKTESMSSVSSHYKAEAAELYSTWQVRSCDSLGVEAARRFQPYIERGDVCLDFGCGGGGILVALEVGKRIGVEPNPVSRELASKRGIETVSSLDEIPDESIDIIISNHALEHCRRPFDEVVAMRRVLRHESKVVLVLPMDDWRRSRSYHTRDINHHLYAWTPLHIGNLLTDAGFEIDSIEIVRHAYPRGAGFLWQYLPEVVFDAICRCWSVFALMRQIRVVARPSHSQQHSDTGPIPSSTLRSAAN